MCIIEQLLNGFQNHNWSWDFILPGYPPPFPNLGNNYSEKFIINFYLIEFNVFNIYMYVLQITSSVLAGVLDEIKTLEKNPWSTEPYRFIDQNQTPKTFARNFVTIKIIVKGQMGKSDQNYVYGSLLAIQSNRCLFFTRYNQVTLRSMIELIIEDKDGGHWNDVHCVISSFWSEQLLSTSS